MGIANGYVNIMLVTWFQYRADKRMMGRMMSSVMAFSVGITPVYDSSSCHYIPPRKSSTMRLNASGFSILGKCAVPFMTTFFAPVIPSTTVSESFR